MILWRRFGARSSCSMMTTQARYPYATSGALPKRLGTDSRTTNCTFFTPLLLCALADAAVRQAMIDEFDLDQDGEINEQEFFAIMTDDA